MVRAASNVITEAYYLSGIVARRFQSVSEDQTSDGLKYLNDVLAAKGIKGNLIPYYKEYSFNAVTGQEEYFIPGLIHAENFTFNIGSVRYSLNATQRNRYFGTVRQDNIKSLPYKWHFERVLNGANLYVYFLPSDNYPMKVWGKFKLDKVTDLCEDLELKYDDYYLNYLEHAVARVICTYYQTPIPLELSKELASLEEELEYVSPVDLSTKKESSLTVPYGVGYGYANLGAGWWP